MVGHGMVALGGLAESAEDERVRVAALRLISEYAYGKAPQPIEGSVEVSHRHYLAEFERADMDADAPRPELGGPTKTH